MEFDQNQLYDFACTFLKALHKKRRHEAFEDRYLRAARQCNDAVGTSISLMIELHNKKFTMGAEEYHDYHHKKFLKIVDLDAKVCLTFCTIAELESMIHPEMRTAEIAEAFKKQGLSSLADLHVPMTFDPDQLTDLSRTFYKAVLTKRDDPSFEDRFIQAAKETKGGLSKNFDLLFDLQDTQKKFGEESSEYTAHKAETEKAIAENYAEICTKFCTAAELKSIVHAEARMDEVVAAFRQHDLPNLARMHKP